MDCLFCKIINKEIQAKTVYEDEKVLAFEDINPQAPIHILIIPKKHFANLNEMTEDDKEVVGHMFLVAGRIAKEKGVSENGYRAVFNTNKDAGQEVFHIHMHLLGGRKFAWPPG